MNLLLIFFAMMKLAHRATTLRSMARSEGGLSSCYDHVEGIGINLEFAVITTFEPEIGHFHFDHAGIASQSAGAVDLRFGRVEQQIAIRARMESLLSRRTMFYSNEQCLLLLLGLHSLLKIP